MEFKADLLEGLFYITGDGVLEVEIEGGRSRAVQDYLKPFLGKHVQLALHHLPGEIMPGVPGLGSCKWSGGSGCPAGHDQHPDRLISFKAEGVLEQNDGGWFIRDLGGVHHQIPLGGMDGHDGRLLAATVLNVDALCETLAARGGEEILSMVEGIDGGHIQEILGKLSGKR